MAEHYTRNTLECTAWCARCNRMTQHRVDGGRKGPCMDANHPKPVTKAVIPPFDDVEKPKQKKLFEE